MAETQYPGNSDRGQETQQTYQKRVTQSVVNGNVERKEHTTWDGIREFFGIAECNTFRDYVSALSDMTNRVYGAIDTLLGNRKYQNSSVPGAKVQYTSYYNAPNQQPVQAQQKAQGPYGQEGLVFDNRQDAEIVLAKMCELLAIYRNVSVGDMFDLAGLSSPNQYVDFKYGWYDLAGVRVIPFGSKYIINLPPAVPIK